MEKIETGGADRVGGRGAMEGGASLCALSPGQDRAVARVQDFDMAVWLLHLGDLDGLRRAKDRDLARAS